jgi:FMN-dependent NADH-azoreductase
LLRSNRPRAVGPDAQIAAEHAQTYLRTVFGFIGVTDLDIIIAEGMQAQPGRSGRSPPR